MRRLFSKALTAAVAVAALGGAFAQDDGRIDDLIRRLGSDDFAARERAQAELVRIGAPALQKLKTAMQDPDPEISLRSRQIVEQIRHNQAVESVLSSGTKVTVQVKGETAGQAARVLGAAAGYKIDIPDALADRRVSLDFSGAELFRVLDALARQLNAGYRFAGTAAISFSEEAFFDAPSAYAGPFKFKVLRIRTTTENEIVRKISEIEITLGVESEPTVKPAERTLRVVQAIDEAGGKVEWEAEPTGGTPMGGGFGMSVSSMTVNGQTIRIVNDNGQLRVVREGGLGSGPGGESTASVTMRDVKGSPAELKKLVCEAQFTIPSNEKRRVVFEKPTAGDTKTVGGVEVAIEEVTDRTIEVSVRSRAGQGRAAELIDKSSLLIRSGGTDYEAELLSDTGMMEDWDPRDARRLQRRIERMMRGGGVDAGGRFLVAIPKGARDKGVDALQFSVKELVQHKLPFEFTDLKLR